MNKPQSTDSNYWDGVYSAFHQNNPPRASVWNEQPTPFFVRLIPWLKFYGIRNMMDAGCGDGRNLKPFIEASFDIIGTDYSKEAIGYCNGRYQNQENLRLICCPLDNIPCEPQSLDVVICDHVLVHIRNVTDVIKQFRALLKKGGYALLEFTSCQDSTFGQGIRLSEREFLQHGVYLRYDEPPDFTAMLSQAGFDVLCFTSEASIDPPHGPGYVRKQRHAHHSYFVVARRLA